MPVESVLPAFNTWGDCCLLHLFVCASVPEPYLNPKEPTFFKDLHKEIIIGNPKKVGALGSREALNSSLQRI